MIQTALITHTLETLAKLGVREFCIAAGARNAPLVAALADSHGIKLWHFFEERCAAFFALGRIMADHQPVAVITTSGTAVAELLPATIEAYYQAQPLILVTADRPERFRGSGAPQAIEQMGLFGCYARFHELSVGNDSPEALNGPLHLNLPLDEPLDCNTPGIHFPPRPPHVKFLTCNQTPTDLSAIQLVLAAGLHPEDAAVAAPVLARLGCPIFAEATANLHDFPALRDLMLHGGERLLKTLSPTHVLRIGAVPSRRWWRDLEDKPEIHVTNISRTSFPGLARKENVLTLPWDSLMSAANSGSDHPFMAESISPDFSLHPSSEPAWMQHIACALSEEARVFLGNSLPIREWSLVCATPLAAGVQFFANRGANGIDGLVSTFLGTAAMHENEAWLILGDLSALYDLAAPWIIPQLTNRRLRIVVINNGGGKIFSRVASMRALPEKARGIIENRHTLGFKPWAGLWQLDYLLAQNPLDLFDLPDSPLLIEIQPDEAQTEAFWKSWSGV